MPHANCFYVEKRVRNSTLPLRKKERNKTRDVRRTLERQLSRSRIKISYDIASTRVFQNLSFAPSLCADLLIVNGSIAPAQRIYEEAFERCYSAFTVFVPDAGPCRSNFRDHPARTNFFLAHPRRRGGTRERRIKRWKGGGVI